MPMMFSMTQVYYLSLSTFKALIITAGDLRSSVSKIVLTDFN